MLEVEACAADILLAHCAVPGRVAVAPDIGRKRATSPLSTIPPERRERNRTGKLLIFWHGEANLVHNRVVQFGMCAGAFWWPRAGARGEIREGTVAALGPRPGAPDKGEAMKIRRTLSHRGFSVATAGYFTVLKPDKWSAVSRQPGTLHTFTDRSKRAASTLAPEQRVLNGMNGQQATVDPAMMQLRTQDLSLKRAALIVSAAMTITSALLWWIMHP